jgi:hypothetical protein
LKRLYILSARRWYRKTARVQPVMPPKLDDEARDRYRRHDKFPEDSDHGPEDDRRRPSRQTPRTEPTSRPSGLSALLQSVDRRDYAEFARRIKDDTSILSEDNENKLTNSAIAALQRNSRNNAKVSIALAILLRDLRLCETLDAYLADLKHYAGPGGTSYEEKHRRLLNYCESEASQRSRSIATSDVPARRVTDHSSRTRAVGDTTKAFEDMALDRDIESSSPPRARHFDLSTAARNQSNRGTAYHGKPPSSYPAYQQPARLDRRDSVTSAGTDRSLRHRMARPDAADAVAPADEEKAPTINDQDLRRRVESNASFEGKVGLRGSFKSRKGNEAKNFFRVGRVFGIFVHEQDTGDVDVSDTMTTRPLVSYNEQLDINIRSHYTRFVVVKEGPVFCWGIPISSYGNRGTHKFRNNPAEVRAHAIIHTNEHPRPVVRDNRQEPRMTKQPIKVIPARPDDDECLLSTASRVNFSRPRTIDHNLKALNIGKVSRQCIVFLETYWAEEMKADTRRP